MTKTITNNYLIFEKYRKTTDSVANRSFDQLYKFNFLGDGVCNA